MLKTSRDGYLHFLDQFFNVLNLRVVNNALATTLRKSDGHKAFWDRSNQET